MSNARRDEIMEAVGAENWENVVVEWIAASEAEIKADLDKMFPTDDNSQLATDIHTELTPFDPSKNIYPD